MYHQAFAERDEVLQRVDVPAVVKDQAS